MSASGFLPTFSFGNYPPSQLSLDQSTQPSYTVDDSDDDSDPYVDDAADEDFHSDPNAVGPVAGGSTIRCSDRGCLVQLPTGIMAKMCDNCGERHREHAMTKRKRRKLDKSAVVHSQIGVIPSLVQEVLWPGPIPPLERQGVLMGPDPPALHQPPEAQPTSLSELNPQYTQQWPTDSIDPRVFSSSSSELAGALTYPSTGTSSSATPPILMEGTSQTPEDSDPATPVEDTSAAYYKSRFSVATSEAVKALPQRYCSIKGCRAVVPGDYMYKMCPECRGKYKRYGDTKRAKWKVKANTARLQLDGLEFARLTEEKRRKEQKLPPLKSLPIEEQRAWEDEALREIQYSLPPAGDIAHLAIRASALPHGNEDQTAEPRPRPVAHGDTPLVQPTAIEKTIIAPTESISLANNPPSAGSARMCSVSHCHVILAGSSRYKRCEQHRAQNRHHSRLKRDREVEMKARANEQLAVGADGTLDSDFDSDSDEEGGGGDAQNKTVLLAGNGREEFDAWQNLGALEFSHDWMGGLLPLPPPVRGARRTNFVCANPKCSNFLAPRSPWKMCDPCRETGRAFRREVDAMQRSGRTFCATRKCHVVMPPGSAFMLCEECRDRERAVRAKKEEDERKKAERAEKQERRRVEKEAEKVRARAAREEGARRKAERAQAELRRREQAKAQWEEQGLITPHEGQFPSQYRPFVAGQEAPPDVDGAGVPDIETLIDIPPLSPTPEPFVPPTGARLGSNRPLPGEYHFVVAGPPGTVQPQELQERQQEPKETDVHKPPHLSTPNQESRHDGPVPPPQGQRLPPSTPRHVSASPAQDLLLRPASDATPDPLLRPAPSSSSPTPDPLLRPASSVSRTSPDAPLGPSSSVSQVLPVKRPAEPAQTRRGSTNAPPVTRSHQASVPGPQPPSTHASYPPRSQGAPPHPFGMPYPYPFPPAPSGHPQPQYIIVYDGQASGMLPYGFPPAMPGFYPPPPPGDAQAAYYPHVPPGAMPYALPYPPPYGHAFPPAAYYPVPLPPGAPPGAVAMSPGANPYAWPPHQVAHQPPPPSQVHAQQMSRRTGKRKAGEKSARVPGSAHAARVVVGPAGAAAAAAPPLSAGAGEKVNAGAPREADGSEAGKDAANVPPTTVVQGRQSSQRSGTEATPIEIMDDSPGSPPTASGSTVRSAAVTTTSTAQMVPIPSQATPDCNDVTMSEGSGNFGEEGAEVMLDGGVAVELPAPTTRSCVGHGCHRIMPPSAAGIFCERCLTRLKKRQAKVKQRHRLEPRTRNIGAGPVAPG